ncbi:DoxX family membrane protein [Herbiconiux sp. CPCC 203407]|uniref:DoxX family membrane protein n=1 Tax=Herbiconiux oxytropis TaxID=2970915 RepID=A0AA42BW90_9MICO|nr:DoxX family membrane protein [Herbiconiux oxytropis]MCS5722096.1 DoxX family membrane protein [Herbiconiux oxytropis]MCS5725678.1 DoxX family membrane protein [Herbiconiux oxytropis]
MDPLSLSALVVRILVATAFIVMGVNHFVPRSVRGMAAMIPPRLRWERITPRALVHLTGVCEIAGGLGLLFPPTRIAAGIALVVFLAAVFPANAYAAKHKERFGALAIPFWPRLIGQVVLAALVLFAAIF